MPVPTEPGFYYWTPPNGAPRIVSIVRAHGMLMADMEPGSPWFTLLAALKGEWGPRIPSPEQLAAMREVLPYFSPISNVIEIAPTGGILSEKHNVCIFCGAPEDPPDSGDAHHAPSCLWLRAQEKPQ